MEIKPYTSADYEGLVGLYKNHHAYGGHFDPDRDTDDRLCATARQGNLYVMYQNGKVAGSFMILENPHSFWLIRFVVNPMLKNESDLATKLFEKACQIAQTRGHQSVIIYTDSDDVSLNQRYADLGCHQADNYRCYWKETTPAVTAA